MKRPASGERLLTAPVAVWTNDAALPPETGWLIAALAGILGAVEG